MKTLKTMLTGMLMMILAAGLSAQNTGVVKGRVLDSLTNESLPGANVYTKIGGNIVGTATDKDGYFTLKPLNPGQYELKISYTGYGELTLQGVRVFADGITFVDDCRLMPGQMITGVTITPENTIKKDVQIDKVITKDQFEKLSDSRNLVKVIAAISPGVMVSDNERDFSFRGARVGDAAMIVDGVAVRGTESGVPSGAISSVKVITGGLPAKYGDTTGGVIVIQTKSYFEWEAERMMMYDRMKE